MDNNTYKNMLKEAGFRNSKLKNALFGQFSSAGTPLSMADAICNNPTAHFVSVYRAIDPTCAYESEHLS